MITQRIFTWNLVFGILLTKGIFAKKNDFPSSDEKNTFPVGPEPKIQNVNFDKARQNVQFIGSPNLFDQQSTVPRATSQFQQNSREMNTKNFQENRQIFTKVSKNGQSPVLVLQNTVSAPQNQPSFAQHIPVSDLNSNFQQNTDIQIQKPEETFDIRNLSSPFRPTVNNDDELDDQNSNNDNPRLTVAENVGILDGSPLSNLINKKFELIVTNLTNDGYLMENSDQKILKNLSESFAKYLERSLHPNSIDQDRITDQEEQILDDTSRNVIEKFKSQHRPVSLTNDRRQPVKKISTNKNDRKFQTPPTLRLPLMQMSEERLPVRPVVFSAAGRDEEPLSVGSTIDGLGNVGQSRAVAIPEAASSGESESASSDTGGFTVRSLLPFNVRPVPTDEESTGPTQGSVQIVPFGNFNRTIIQPRIPIPLDHESQPPETNQAFSGVDSNATPPNSAPFSQFTQEPIASPPGFLPPMVGQSSPPSDNADFSVRRSFVDFTAIPIIVTEATQIGSGFELATISPAFPTPPDWTASKAASLAEEEQNVTSSGGASEEEEGGASSSPVPPTNEASTPESVVESGAAFLGSTPTGSEESGESESSASESELTSLIPGGQVFHNISGENGAALENSTDAGPLILTGSTGTEAQESEENSTTLGATGTTAIVTESLATVTQSANESSVVAVSTTAEAESNETSLAPGLVVVTSASATKETTESNDTEETGGVTAESGVSATDLEGNETTSEYNSTAAMTIGSMFENQTTAVPEMVNATSGEGEGQENATTTPGGRPVQGTAAWRLRLTDVAWDSSLNDKMSWQYRKLYDNVYPDLKQMFTDVLKDNYAGTTIERFSAGSVIVSGKTESYDKVDNAQFGDSLDKQLKIRKYKLGSHDVDPDTINVDLPGGSSPQVAPKTSTAGMPGYVIAIIVAAVAVLGVILIGAYFVRRRRNRQRENTYMVDEETMNGAAKSLQNVQPQQRPLGASRNGVGSNAVRAEQMASINMYEMKDNPGAGAPPGQAAQTGQANTNFGYQDDGVSFNRAQRNGSSDKNGSRAAASSK